MTAGVTAGTAARTQTGVTADTIVGMTASVTAEGPPDKALPVISVIVPVYDAEVCLERCVRSILNQTYGSLEIILVDDGSRDKSPEMCDAYATGDSRVRVIHKPNEGLMSAWTAGVKLSTGSYLCFIDSDDWVETDMLKEMMKAAAGCWGEVICGNFVIERPGRTTAHYHRLAPGEYSGKKLQTEVKEQLLGHENRTVSMSRCMKLFSRELITENMKYCNPAIRMGEDVNIVLPALIDSSRVVILKDALHYHYFYHEASMVHKYDTNMADGIGVLIRTVERIYLNKPVKDWEEQLGREKQFLLMLAVKNELRGGRKGYTGRIKELCAAQHTAELAKHFPIRPKSAVNKILKKIMDRPVAGNIIIGKTAFEVYDLVRKLKSGN